MTTYTENLVNHHNHVEPTEVDLLREDVPDDSEKKELRFGNKVFNVFSNITVEPCIFLMVTGTMITNMASQNLQLEKACRVNLNFSKEICDSLRLQDGVAHNDYEREIQRLVASALAWRTYLTATLPCFLALFVGSFSDITGYRKLFIIVPIIGQILVGINNKFSVHFFYQINLEKVIFSDAIIEGLTGGWCICFLSAFAYISAITTEQDRTYRIGIVGFCITFGMPVGVGLSGILLRLVGFYGVYLISISIHSLNALYSIFVLKDPKRSPEQKEHADRGCCHLMRIFFNFTNVKETIRVIVRNAPNNRRLRLCVLLLVVTVIFGPMQGEMSIMYLSVRFRFQWDEIQYSLFQTYNLIINFIGTTFTILVLARHFGWHDSLLGIISSISKIAASFVYGFAQSGAIFYLGPVIDILNGTALLAMRAIMSKLVELEELGKLSSVVGIAENLMPLIYVPMYTRVYSATLDVLPGAVFLLGALLTLPVVAVLSNFFYEHRKQVGKLKSSPIELE
ncbi:unnamed protein product [Arctia plantaginis]|uniref:Uncharacterized protein n=1 Tax=Arctia plantaginis TaxID=874455 RepID=A0A8S1A6U8_ARCPL|nr:unnamed protein product [Arctia plantaginis]